MLELHRARVLVVAGVCAMPLSLAGCGGGGVSLAALTERQQAFVGEVVHVVGTVERQRDPNGQTYYVLSDGKGDLVGLKPATRAGRYRGDRVSVRGRFAVQGGFGRVLFISLIQPRGS